MASTAVGVSELANAQQPYVGVSCSEFHWNGSRNVGSVGRNLFTALSNIWLPLSQFHETCSREIFVYGIFSKSDENL